MKTFTEQFGEPEFHPIVPKKDFKLLVGHSFILKDAKIIKDFSSEFGNHDLAFMMGEENEEQFTTISSGQVILSGIKQYLNGRKPPVMVTVEFVEKDDRGYYRLV